MKLDNSKTIISFRIKLFAVTVLFLAYIILSYAAKMFKLTLFGMSDTFWTIILAAIWLFVALLPMFLNYQYVSYSDEGDTIIFRYFTSGIVGGKKNSVEIDKRTFAGYKTEKKLFGLVWSITLYQNFKEGVAKYPTIYISALKKEERSKIIRSLNLYAPGA
ncbi:MAG: hypothetical protein A2X05_13585 [Bacteroidetes bacterium GWE2_41_25]|nr:MAG: hypothetical protein A2X03_08280 [Bacteroidetes bacterium GWA2_40_15]OFX97394.1 MAG: hypothetical protein A2X06_15540 [Bacteroidetes bacterium GWC2_40_22]OFX97828.1 MAG: hypothetical protein A2X05_13585 [Bacteroidetes bacterium GWE2_41_25]HBH83291.1 hypothetical protein [Bacteroidales bacterium]HBQ81360.1 hypothetical protein [Bacteroidales bacterium]